VTRSGLEAVASGDRARRYRVGGVAPDDGDDGGNVVVVTGATAGAGGVTAPAHAARCSTGASSPFTSLAVHTAVPVASKATASP